MLTSELKKMEQGNSIFEREVRKLDVPICQLFRDKQGRIAPVAFNPEGKPLGTKDAKQVALEFNQLVTANGNKLLRARRQNLNPAVGKRVAVLFSGGPAAGGHNVVAGLQASLGKQNTLLGVRGGPQGLLDGQLFAISGKDIKRLLNTGGFDFLGSDRTKIKSPEQFAQVRKVCAKNKLNALVIIGGDDSNTNAALLAEYLYPDVQVIGVPKTIDGDLQVGQYLPISFGFDTATKIYAELVGNILQDTPSSRKYWHFIKLMGRAASHVALEVALQTRPAIALISEEIAARKIPLRQIIDSLAKTVIRRCRKGIRHGVVIIPEGLIEFIPDMVGLLKALNEMLAQRAASFKNLSLAERRALVAAELAAEQAALFKSLPGYLQEMLLLDRDAHGNLQVSQIPTERLLIDMTAARIKEISPGTPFAANNHFFGYEGRCGAPSLFDAAYTFNLGLIAGSLILDNRTGYMAALSELSRGGKILALPLTGLINIERRHGKDEMVIAKALVRTSSPAFKFLAARRKAWSGSDLFTSPGPRQLWGPAARQLPISVALNQGYADLSFKL
ncbi:diphosphate--fructose-6-phosphate 1-phosphotransferase [Candidatus Termititenax persephonae]|uniref:Diphosphate--fructose-6-phosphate 1-phosphotransferase n=1 Tax=Candidatus Termititenax persephonae TaxID=2218525 RepID=A0A388THK0_9BACT|nr:diphosphate--fructose-6-phosphate 1-phosphotransferase [Candidatus Termititenax persephonae]